MREGPAQRATRRYPRAGTETRPDEDVRFVIQRELSFLQPDVRDSTAQIEGVAAPGLYRGHRRRPALWSASGHRRPRHPRAAQGVEMRRTRPATARNRRRAPATASGVSAIRLSGTVILVSYLSEQDGEQTRRSSRVAEDPARLAPVLRPGHPHRRPLTRSAVSRPRPPFRPRPPSRVARLPRGPPSCPRLPSAWPAFLPRPSSAWPVLRVARLPRRYRFPAQLTHRVAVGRAVSRSRAMGWPQRSHCPYPPSSSRRSAASIEASWPRAWPSSAATCWRSKAIVAPSGSCSSSVSAESTLRRCRRTRAPDRPAAAASPPRSAASASRAEPDPPPCSFPLPPPGRLEL